MSLLPTSHRLQLMFPPSIVGLFSTLRMPEPREMNITNKGMRLFRSAAIDEDHSEQFWKLWRRCNADFAMCGLKVRRTQGQWYVTQTLLPSGVLDEEDERYYRTLKGDQQAMLALETEIVHFDPPPLPAHLEAMLKEYQIPCARQILYALRTYGGAWDCSDMGWGKAQPLSEPILTPHGWTIMGKVQAGSYVMGSDGAPTRVVSVHPKGFREVFQVTFNDGTSTRCCEEHLWTVRTGCQKFRGQGYKTKSVKELRHDLKDKSGNMKWHIPIAEPVQFESSLVPMDPYFMGLLLGDGCFRGNGVSISTSDEEIVEFCKYQAAIYNLRLVHRGKWDHAFVAEAPKANNKLLNAIRGMGLHKLYSCQKFVPKPFMTASLQDRLSLLQGLMDSDGWVSRDGFKTQFCTVSAKLAEDVADIVRSLGGIARIGTKVPKFTHNGIKKEGMLAFQINISIKQCPFRLTRKAKRWRMHAKYTGCKTIRSIEPAGVEECQCIKVAAEDHLYITKDYILTHNTYQTTAAAIAFGKRPAIICPKSVKADWKDTLKKFNVSPLFVETWEAMALGSTPWAKRIGEGIAWNLPDNVIVIADEAQAARHAHVSWAGKMILALARQEIPTICASATIAMSPSEMLATGAIIGLHDGTRDGFARFASNYGCLNTGGTWMFDKRNSSALVRLHRQVFPRRGARGKIETLGDKFPKTEIITRMIDVAQEEREKIIKAYHDAAKLIERLERQGDLRAAKMAGLQQWQKAYHASEMVLVPYIAAMVKEAINEGWHCPVFMNFDDTREKMMEALGTTCTIHGAMNEQQRTHAKAMFQSDESPVIVLNLKAGGTGVSLHDTIGNFPRKSFIFPFSQAIKMKQGFGRVQRTNGVTASQQIIPWVTETPQVQICASVRASLANLDSLNDGLLTPKLRF